MTWFCFGVAESSVPPVKSATEGAEHNADEVSLPTTPAVAQPAAQSLRQESSEVGMFGVR